MTKSIFISRTLTENSPIKLLARNHDVTIQAQSLIQFEKVEFEPPKTEWLFFYSKTGVKYFFRHPEASKFNYKLLCFGPATASYCKKLATIIDSAEGTVKSAISMVEEHLKDEQITFVCGNNSLRSVQKVMSDKTFHEVVVYNNKPKASIPLGAYAIAILTSPMNARTFLSNGGKAKKYITIGPTTAKTLSTLNRSVVIAGTPSEEGIATALVELLNN